MKKAILLINSLLLTVLLLAQPQRYWVQGSGSWNETEHWSEQSGGAPGASVPDENTDVVFDQNSGIGKPFTVELKQTTKTGSFSASTNATFKGKVNLEVNGNLTISNQANFNKYTGDLVFTGVGQNYVKIETPIKSTLVFNSAEGIYTLNSDLLTTKSIELNPGRFYSNNNNIEANSIYAKGNEIIYADFGTSSIKVNIWDMSQAQQLVMDASKTDIVMDGSIAENFKGGEVNYNQVTSLKGAKAITAVVVTPTPATCPNNASGTTTNGSVNVLVNAGVGTFIVNLRKWNSGLGDYQTIATLNGSNVTFNTVSSGSYQIWVRETLGDEPNATLTNVGPELLIPHITVSSLPQCFGGTIQLTATPTGGTTPPAYTYVWKNNSNVTVAVAATTGDLGPNKYTAIVTDGVGCSAQESYTYIPGAIGPQPLTMSGVTSTASCQGEDNGTITVASVTGGTPDFIGYPTSGYGYAVVPTGDPAPVAFVDGNGLTDLPPNNYDLYIIDGSGCTKKHTAVVTVGLTLKPVPEAGPNGSTCQSDAYTVSGASVDLNTSSFSWSHNGSGTITNGTTLTPTYTPHANDLLMPGGIVTLTLSANGIGACSTISVTDTRTLTITKNPAPDAGLATDATCGLSYNLNGIKDPTTLGSVLWTKVSGPGNVSFTDATIVNPSVTVTAYGVYQLQLAETASGCSGTDIITVTFVQSPSVTLNDASICEDDTYNFPDAVVTNNASILWTNLRTGDGTGFSNRTILKPTFTPDPIDIAAGTINLQLTAIATAPCVDASKTITLTILPNPSPNAGANDETCANFYNLNGTREFPGSTLLWTRVSGPASGVATFASASAEDTRVDVTVYGLYTFQLSETVGGLCVGTSQVQIDFQEGPSGNAGADLETCKGVAVTLTPGHAAANNGTLLWTTPDGAGVITNATTLTPTYTPDPLETGDITLRLTITGTDACIATSLVSDLTLTINNTPTPSITAGKAGVCIGSTEPYTTQAGMSGYQWNVVGGNIVGASNTNTITVNWTTLGAGSVSINYTSVAGCTAPAPTVFAVTVYGNPDPDLTINATSVCEGDNLALNGNPLGGSGTYTTHLWSGAGAAFVAPTNTQNTTFNSSTPNSYALTYTVTDNRGCSGSDNMTVSVLAGPTADAGNDLSTCQQQAITLPNGHATAANATLLWTTTGIGALTNATTLTPTYTPAIGETGDITLTLTATGLLGCSGSSVTDNFTLTINPWPVPSIVTGDADVCLGSTEVYTTQPGMSNYQWNVTGGTIVGATNTNSITVNWNALIVGSVNINYTNGNNCTANVPTVFTVTVNANPQPDLSVNSTTACEGQNLNLSGNPLGGTGVYTSHAWSGAGVAFLTPTNALNTVFNCPTPGTYNVIYTVTDTRGCVGSDNIDITNLQGASANAGPDTVICSDGTYTVVGASVSNNDNLMWTNNGGDGFFDDPTLLNPTYTPGDAEKTAGTFTLTLLATNATCGNVSDDMVVTFAPKLEASVGGVSPFIISASTAINVTFWGTHEWVYDLGFYLVSPDLQDTLRLYSHLIDQNGDFCWGLDDNIDSLTFTTNPAITGNLSLCDLPAGDLTGTYQPTEAWSKIYGQDPAKGGWALLIRDCYSGDAGFLTRARISFKDNDQFGNPKEIVFDSKAINEQIFDPFVPGSCSSTSYIVPIGLRTSCFGACDAMALVNVVGGTPPYVSYEWNDASNSQNDTVMLCGGDFEVTVTDSRGCQSVALVSVLEPDPVILAFDSTNVKCFGDNTGMVRVIATSGSGSYTYKWDDAAGSTTAQVNNLPAGTYTVTVTDGNSCNTIGSVTIVEPTPLSVTNVVVDSTNCNATDGSIMLTISGGTPAVLNPNGYTFLWSNGATTNPATGLGVGVYTATITDSLLCSIDTTITMIDKSSMVINGFAMVNPVLCYNDCNGEVSVNVTNGSGTYSYNWSGAGITGTNPTLQNVCGDSTYTVIITDDVTTCTISDSYTIPNITQVVIAITSSTPTLCHSDSTGTATVLVSGGAAGYNYYWITSTNDTIANGPTASNLPYGYNKISVVDANGCTALDSVFIDRPAQLSATTAITPTGCGTATGTASAIPLGGSPASGLIPYTYLWDDANTSTDSVITNLATGTYNVTVTDANGCTATASASIVDNSNLVVTLNTSTEVTCAGTCNGQASISVSGGNMPYNITWSSGESGPIAFNLCAGLNIVTVTDFNGCSQQLPVLINEPSPIATFVNLINNPTCSTSTNGSARVVASGGTGALSYFWSDGQTTDLATGLLGGWNYVTVTDIEGCSKLDSIELITPNAIQFSMVSNPTTCGDSTGTVTVQNITGGTGAYVVSWAHTSWSSYPAPDSTNMPTLTNLWVSNFVAIVSDVNGCTTRDSLDVIDTSPMVVNIDSIHAVSCNGGNDGAALVSGANGTGSYTYLWSNGNTNDLISNVMAGSYGVTVTDANQCSRSNIVSIPEPAALTNQWVYTQPIVCAGDTEASLYAAINGGIRPYTYLWTNSASQIVSTDSALINAVADTYNLTVSDANHCNLTDNVVIFEPTPLSTSIITTTTLCNVATGTAQVTVSGGIAPYTYHWYVANNPALVLPNNDQPNIASLWADVFVVDVTDSLGCMVSEMVEITDNSGLDFNFEVLKQVWCNDIKDGQAAVINVNQPLPIGAVTNYSTLWSDGFAADTNKNLGIGEYFVTVTENTNGCRRVKSLNMGNSELFRIFKDSVQNYSQNDAICVGEAFVYPRGGDVSQNNKYIIFWLGQNNDTVQIDTLKTATSNTYASRTDLCEGYYKFIARNNRADGHVCEVTDSIYIIRDLLRYQILYKQNVLCGDANTGAVAVQALGGHGDQYPNGEYFYSWSNKNWSSYPNADSTTNAITNLAAGRYYLTITDNRGSMINDSIDISEPVKYIPSLVINPTHCGDSTGSISVNEAASVGGMAPFTYTWSHPNWTQDSTGITLNNLWVDTYYLRITDASLCVTDTLINLPDTSNLVLTLDFINDATCYGSATGTAGVFATNGTRPYTYTWSNGTTDSVIVNVIAGMYQARITDVDLCSRVQMVEIGQPDSLYANIVITEPVVCAGDTEQSMYATSIGGVKPYTYLWENNGVTVSSDSALNNVTAGWYYLTVFDDNNCQYIDSIEVYNPAPLAVTYDSVLTACPDSTGWFEAKVTGGMAPYQYNWQVLGNPIQTIEGNGTDSIFNLWVDVYTLQITDALGCTLLDTVEMGDSSGLDFDFEIMKNVWCNDLKDGQARVFNVYRPDSINYLTNFTALWSDGFVGDSNLNLAVGQYTITVTEAAEGCKRVKPLVMSDKDLFRIYKDSVQNYTQDDQLCVGEAFVYPRGGDVAQTSKYIVYWLDANNDTVQIDSLKTATSNTFAARYNLCDGYYKFIVKNNRTDGRVCEIVDSIYIIRDLLRFDTVLLQNVLCYGENSGAIAIQALGGFGTQYPTGAYNYAWSNTNWSSYPAPDSTGQAITNLVAGRYYFTITDNRGSIINDSIDITQQPTMVIFDINPINPPCADSTGSIEVFVNGGNPGYTYQWAHPDWADPKTGSLLTDVWPDDYHLTVFDNNGCRLDSLVTLNDNSPFSIELIAGAGGEICYKANDGNIVVNASNGTEPYRYIWAKDGVVTDTLFTDRYNNLSGGLYRVIVTDENLCRRAESVNIFEADSVTFQLADTLKNLCYTDTLGSITLANIQGGWDNFTNYIMYNEAEQFIKTQTLAKFDKLPVGKYKFEVDAGGCPSAKIDFTFYSELPGLKETFSSTKRPDCNYDSPTGHLMITLQPHFFGVDTTAVTDKDYQYLWNDGTFGVDNFTNNAIAGVNIVNVRQFGLIDGTCVYSFDSSLTAITNINMFSWINEDPDQKSAYFCPADTVTLNTDVRINASSSIEPDSILWSDSQFILNNTNDATQVLALTQTSREFVADAWFNNCHNVDTLNVRKFIIEQVNAELVNESDTVVFVGNQIDLKANVILATDDEGTDLEGIGVYNWTSTRTSDVKWETRTDTITPTASGQNTTYFTVAHVFLVMDYNQMCTQYDSVKVTVLPIFDPPKGFSPNGDTKYDTWELPGIMGYQSVNIIIFNRWGGKVWEYSGNNYDGNKFEGKNTKGEDLPSGTYYFVMELVNETKTDKVSGPVTILR